MQVHDGIADIQRQFAFAACGEIRLLELFGDFQLRRRVGNCADFVEAQLQLAVRQVVQVARQLHFADDEGRTVVARQIPDGHAPRFIRLRQPRHMQVGRAVNLHQLRRERTRRADNVLQAEVALFQQVFRFPLRGVDFLILHHDFKVDVLHHALFAERVRVRPLLDNADALGHVGDGHVVFRRILEGDVENRADEFAFIRRHHRRVAVQRVVADARVFEDVIAVLAQAAVGIEGRVVQRQVVDSQLPAVFRRQDVILLERVVGPVVVHHAVRIRPVFAPDVAEERNRHLLDVQRVLCAVVLHFFRPLLHNVELAGLHVGDGRACVRDGLHEPKR